MHGYNTHVPAPPGTPDAHSDQEHMFFGKVRFSLASAMTAMLALGVPLTHIVSMVTRNVVEIFGLPDELGTLKPDSIADVSVLNDHRGSFNLSDNEGTQLRTGRMLSPAFCLKSGELFQADAGILPDVRKLVA